MKGQPMYDLNQNQAIELFRRMLLKAGNDPDYEKKATGGWDEKEGAMVYQMSMDELWKHYGPTMSEIKEVKQNE